MLRVSSGSSGSGKYNGDARTPQLAPVDTGGQGHDMYCSRSGGHGFEPKLGRTGCVVLFSTATPGKGGGMDKMSKRDCRGCRARISNCLLKCLRDGFGAFSTFKYRVKGDTNSCKLFVISKLKTSLGFFL